jgi:hypothetical protein
MPSGSPSPEEPSSAARTIPTSPRAGGSARRISNREIHLSIQPKPCEWCGNLFVRKSATAHRAARFCGLSCSAKWRMSQPGHLAKVHTPEVAAKRGEGRRAWLASGSPQAQAEIHRIRTLNPAIRPEVQAKISRTLKAKNHGPSVRGGNGRGLTVPQRRLLDALGPSWQAEFVLSLGRRTPGYPTHYKLDLAHPGLRIDIELDGTSHRSTLGHERDLRKDTKLDSLGWKVLRFSNWKILGWLDSGMPPGDSISTTLALHGIRPIR